MKKQHFSEFGMSLLPDVIKIMRLLYEETTLFRIWYVSVTRCN